MTQFIKAGKLEKTYNALRIVLDNQAGAGGDLVIGAAAVRDLMAGQRVVEISRVTVRGDQVSITYAGVARASTTGRGVVMHIAGARYTSPLSQVRAVVAGTRSAALVSQMVDEAVIDADETQAQAQQGGRRIDEGLAHSFA
jgi:hypothetical protein